MKRKQNNKKQNNKSSTNRKAVAFLNLGLTEELNSRLNKYILKVATHKGKIPHAIKTKIGRRALKEWLDKHEDDPTIF